MPDDLKTARVVPLFKKNDKTDVGNYRPVSILSTVSKIFERVIYDQLEEYLANKNVLYDYQRTNRFYAILEGISLIIKHGSVNLLIFRQ